MTIGVRNSLYNALANVDVGNTSLTQELLPEVTVAQK